ncbi:hypothetical protein ERICIV_00972 [Paenibacillus larvae subsp. larvae]|uniref:CBM-cenC domain-containing protein n=1 Tax=Paenibacillus larvae subsp. larvae TaxID=147375 RepID=A0A2L1TWU5_9BACL|nr:hypothetical protein [Paenibacillus larvae]AQT85756.1 hypothetical protein B1222_17200 [Paenibacillus larvae subsp. pulvifaciens]AQZ47720.1 hypothetical protein B5S25_15190 [Paenibacillus larvae subsp. pulvifaciens]AVF25157.1 hypothetical protein ERICIII_00952 [Paenibacillus larvae subsp. larvae]AVF29933.1 hypothetical protein ERICIV_00972 [Paenibacillus larvae subsp. larvae]MBH0343211.1 hypothetical protein [Paenibacillus larvae]
MKKIIASIALVGMLAGSSTVGMVQANSLDQTEKIPIESNHFKSQVIAEDNFASWDSSIFVPLSHKAATINNGTLSLNYSILGMVVTDLIKVEPGKKYKITLKKVEGSLVVGVGLSENKDLEWEDNDNHGNNITHVFTAEGPVVRFALWGDSEVSLQGFVLEQID